MYDPNGNDSFNRFRNMVSRQGATNSNDYGLGVGSPGVPTFGQESDSGGGRGLDQMGPMPSRGPVNNAMPRGPMDWRRGPMEFQGMPRPQGGLNWRRYGQDQGFGPGEFQGMPRPMPPNPFGGPGRSVPGMGGPAPIDPMRAHILIAGNNPGGSTGANTGIVPPGYVPSRVGPAVQPPWVETPFEQGSFGPGESQAMPIHDGPKAGWDWGAPPAWRGPWNK